MVDPEQILANALDDDYAQLYDADFLPSLNVSSKSMEDTSFQGDDTESMENSSFSEASSSKTKVSGFVDFLRSEEFMGISEDCKLKTDFIPPKTLCTNPQIRLALCKDDLKYIPPCYTLIEKALLCGENPDDPYDTFAIVIRRRCIEGIMKDRYECMFAFDQLLAMLAHVCACSISNLLPPGEVSYPAERYLADQMEITELKTVRVGSLKRVTIARVKFLFDLISFWDFMHYGEFELMLLLFAFAKIYIDNLSDIQIQLLICNAASNVFSGFSEQQRRLVFYNFSSVFEFVHDMEGLHMVMKMMSGSPVLNPCKLVCLRRILVHYVERAEFDPENADVTEEKHFEIIVILFRHFFHLFKKNRQKVYSMLKLLSEVVDFELLNTANPDHLSKLVECLREMRRAFVKERTSSGSVLERATEAIIRRIEICRPWKVSS